MAKMVRVFFLVRLCSENSRRLDCFCCAIDLHRHSNRGGAWILLPLYYLYEVFLADMVVEHNPQITGKITRILSVGGIICITTPNPMSIIHFS